MRALRSDPAGKVFLSSHFCRQGEQASGGERQQGDAAGVPEKEENPRRTEEHQAGQIQHRTDQVGCAFREKTPEEQGGQLSAVQLMGVMQETGKPLSRLTEVITILPQVLVNMEATVDMKAGLAESLEISAAVRACEEELRGEGRVLIRPSGTEPLIRVMVEGPEQRQIEDIARRIVAAIREALS